MMSGIFNLMLKSYKTPFQSCSTTLNDLLCIKTYKAFISKYKNGNAYQLGNGLVVEGFQDLEVLACLLKLDGFKRVKALFAALWQFIKSLTEI